MKKYIPHILVAILAFLLFLWSQGEDSAPIIPEAEAHSGRHYTRRDHVIRCRVPAARISEQSFMMCRYRQSQNQISPSRNDRGLPMGMSRTKVSTYFRFLKQLTSRAYN